jgi:hypothetical protein
MVYAYTLAALRAALLSALPCYSGATQTAVKPRPFWLALVLLVCGTTKFMDSPPSSPRPTRSLRARRRLSFSANDGQPKRNSEHPLQKERKHHLFEFQRLNLIEEYISITAQKPPPRGAIQAFCRRYGVTRSLPRILLSRIRSSHRERPLAEGPRPGRPTRATPTKVKRIEQILRQTGNVANATMLSNRLQNG